MLSSLVVNLIALAMTVWLGLYIVSRNPRSTIAWLSAFTLWSTASYFYNFLLALDPPLSPELLPLWMKPLLWFWPKDAFENGWGNWIKGWQIIPAIMLWHHVTLLFRPIRMNWWRWTRVIFGYLIAVVSIYYLRNTSLFFSSDAMADTPLDLTTLRPGELYPFFMGVLFLFVVMSILNLIRSARSAQDLQKKQLELMTAATIIAGLTAPIGFIAIKLNFHMPRIILTLLLGGAIFMIGYGVARYNALSEGRIIERDFFYNLTGTFLIAVLYFVATWSSVLSYQIPVAIIATLMVFAIITHSLVDMARQLFDVFFYQRETRDLRKKLRALIQQIHDASSLDEYLAPALETLCKNVLASNGIILLFDDNKIKLISKHKWRSEQEEINLDPNDLTSDDWIELPTGKLAHPYNNFKLLVPLYATDNQVGVMLLGYPEKSNSYSPSDMERILDAGDLFADAIHATRTESVYLNRLVHEVYQTAPRIQVSDSIYLQAVEKGLQNFFDYAYLSDNPLGKMKLVTNRFSNITPTHIERGKAVQAVMLSAIEKMKPDQDLPTDIPPRKWHLFIILYDAYVNGIQNRDIMSRLYISEGTFNRTRRAAIRSLARVLAEMEISA